MQTEYSVKLLSLAQGYFSLVLVMMGTIGFAQDTEFSAKLDAGITDVSTKETVYGHGAAAADYDGDGDIDFYLCTNYGIADRLYKNNGQGIYQDVASELGLEVASTSRAALWFDYNGDARLDLLVLGERCSNSTCMDPILVSLYKQEENGQFTDVTEASGINFNTRYDNLSAFAVGGALAGDINRDGYLDILVTVWGGKSSLFLNKGNGTFSDISLSSGIGTTEAFYWQPMIHDFDGDGLVDIYCNVDYGKNQFWLNLGNSKFNEIGGEIGVDSDFNEMGMTLGDYDNDGDLDIYSTNITRTFQGKDQHNVLLVNNSVDGVLQFAESSEQLGVSQSGWDWGTTFVDVNNDGWLDLASTNGWHDVRWGADQSHLWLNSESGYVDFSIECQFSDELSATTLVSFDMDRDGDMDLLQTLKANESTDMPAMIYENHLELASVQRNFIVVKPRMSGPNHFAIGAVVQVKAGNISGTKVISAGCSFYGQEPAEAFFGLGQNESVDEIAVRWPDGQVSIFGSNSVNQSLTLDYEVVKPPKDFQGDRQANGVQLTWVDDADNENGFLIQRSSTTSFESYTNFVVGANETAYFDPVDDPSLIFYRIKSFNANVSSPFSQPLQIDLVTDIKNESFSFDAYPNPTKSKIAFKIEDAYVGEVQISLMAMDGRKVLTKTFHKTDFFLNHQVEINLNSSIYILQIALGKKVKRIKLIVSD